MIIGTIAAAWQSSIGSVAAGSLFAILQSMAMSGVFMGVGGVLIAGGLFEWAKEGLKRVWDQLTSGKVLEGLKQVGGGLGWVWDQLMSGKVLEWFRDSFRRGLASRDADALVPMRGGEGEGPDPGAAGALVSIKGEEGKEKREGGEGGEEEGEGRKPDPGAAGELVPRGGGGHDGNRSLDELYLSLRVADTKPSSVILIEFRDICLPNGELTIQMAEFKILQEVLAEEGYTPGTYSLTWESSDSCNIAVRTQRGLVTQLRKFLKENQGNKTVPLHCYYYLKVNGTSSAAPDSTSLTPHSF